MVRWDDGIMRNGELEKGEVEKGGIGEGENWRIGDGEKGRNGEGEKGMCKCADGQMGLKVSTKKCEFGDVKGRFGHKKLLV